MIDWRLTLMIYLVGALIIIPLNGHLLKRDVGLRRTWDSLKEPWFGETALWVTTAACWPVIIMTIIRGLVDVHRKGR